MHLLYLGIITSRIARIKEEEKQRNYSPIRNRLTPGPPQDGLLLSLPSEGRHLLSNGSLLLSQPGQQHAGLYQCTATLPGVGTLLSTPARVTTTGTNCDWDLCS